MTQATRIQDHLDRYPNAARLLFDRPWAILDGTLSTMVDIWRMRAVDGIRLSDDDIQARIQVQAAQPRGNRLGGKRAGLVGIIPVYGVISQRAGLMANSSGGTSVEGLQSMFRDAMSDPDISAIVFDIDSPGGSVDGIPEFAAEVRAARGKGKPIVAQANAMAASAAYWIASAADRIHVTPSGQVGSIGVLAAHQDLSGAYEQQGVRTTLIRAGRYKGEANEFEPLSEEARANIQDGVDHYFQMFLGDVAAGRGTTVDAVRDGYGQGRMMVATKAKRAGMVDQVRTLDDTVAKLARDGGQLLDPPAPAGQDQAAIDGGQRRFQVQVPDVPPKDPVQDVLDQTVGDPFGDDDDQAGAGAVAAAGIMSATTDGLGSGLPFAARLKLVAAEVAAIADHARRRAELRSQDGRTLSADTLADLAAMRAELQQLDAAIAGLVDAGDPKPGAAVGASLDLLMQAYQGGYPVDDLVQTLKGRD